MIIMIYPYNKASKSARALRDGIKGSKLIRTSNSSFTGGKDFCVINWGHSGDKWRDWGGSKIINHPANVNIAADKLRFFRKVSEYNVVTPEYTTSPVVAADWQYRGETVMARTVLRGHSAQGLVVIGPGDITVEAPLYTKFVPIDNEFRVHVVGGEVIDVRLKTRRKAVPEEEANYKVRSHKNGFMFMKNFNVDVNEDVKNEAVKAVHACGLDFGAVDVVESGGGAYVLEVNTAPGLVASTIDLYAEKLENIIRREFDEE